MPTLLHPKDVQRTTTATATTAAATAAAAAAAATTTAVAAAAATSTPFPITAPRVDRERLNQCGKGFLREQCVRVPRASSSEGEGVLSTDDEEAAVIGGDGGERGGTHLKEKSEVQVQCELRCQVSACYTV